MPGSVPCARAAARSQHALQHALHPCFSSTASLHLPSLGNALTIPLPLQPLPTPLPHAPPLRPSTPPVHLPHAPHPRHTPPPLHRHTYERKDIEEWLLRSGTSPLSGMPMEHRLLVPNLDLRSAVLEWLQQHALSSKAA